MALTGIYLSASFSIMMTLLYICWLKRKGAVHNVPCLFCNSICAAAHQIPHYNVPQHTPEIKFYKSDFPLYIVFCKNRKSCRNAAPKVLTEPGRGDIMMIKLRTTTSVFRMSLSVLVFERG